MSAPVIRVDKIGKIAHVVLCNPEKRNSMGVRFQQDLRDAMKIVDEDDEIRAAVMRAEGKSFCAGLDLMAIAMVDPSLNAIPSPAGNKPKIHRIIRDFQESITTVETCRKPVIAAIHGHCIGGGLDLVAACDIRLAASDVVFSLREARVAIMADLGSLQRLPYIIGEGHTRQLAYTAEDFGLERAERIGLVNDGFDSHEALWAAADEMAERIALNAPLAVQTGKDVLNWGRGRSLSASLDYVAARNASIFPSEDLMEAIQSFMQKKEPDFKGN